ncbi:NAD(P)/FAD-dependent oxidoreductase [Cellulomonas shaoxiangyii]|uniref:NAD(P)/FAD-dependent oxidoreductase n=1 Tax=Cellulomonas shaoxiangyii TaxID=2566013 RepID=A0A4P7SGX4_9CELL|nr:NAD(P)/FAD-dependent oxidoreductase [Cellulomonas shaoxiangyii]QCB92757.1 NAD(P)/FAD-dependent oxidoreductase [Cellulomonas shaoxiangyii]TGY81523.1 NAD(P)/FAD-dependent oxidoreductase [Cellulomonas shaoxiangyii]
MTDRYDVVVVGGGAAGLAAAVTLGRSLRSVLVVDAGEPRNAPAAGAHNLLGREGVPPQELLAAGRREAESYGAEVRSDRAVGARRDGDGLVVSLAEGGDVRARVLLLATGLTDVLPDVPGVRERWGADVLHCPYCHGWEVRGRRIGVLATSDNAPHQALLMRQLSDDVTLFLHSGPDLEDTEREQLVALDVRLVQGTVERLDHDDDALRAVVLADGRRFDVDAVAVAPRFVANADLYEQLGGTVSEHPFGTYVSSSPGGRTDLPDVWVAGNATDLAAMVGGAATAGVLAAAGINGDLVHADAEAAVRRRSERFDAATEARPHASLAGGRVHGLEPVGGHG